MLGFGAIAEVGLADLPNDGSGANDLVFAHTDLPDTVTLTFGIASKVVFAGTDLPDSLGFSIAVDPPDTGGPGIGNPDDISFASTDLPDQNTMVFNGAASIGAIGGPHYIALVNATDTTFGPSMERYDLVFTRARLRHKEGQKASLELDVLNPGVGLLSLPEWLWWSWVDTEGTMTPFNSQPAGTVYPIFFGHILAIPDTPIGEKVTLRYVGEPNDAIFQLQQVAQTLKTAGLYDPVWLSPTDRDNPEKIIAAYTKSYYYPRIAIENSVSTSDWIVGEDGNISFLCSDGTTNPGDVPYVSFDQRVSKAPLIAARIEADVSWRQVWTSIIDFGTFSFNTYMDGLYNQWPKVGTQLGGGYSVWSAGNYDVYMVHETVTVNSQFNYRNQETVHTDGDTMSISSAMTWPLTAGPTQKYTITDISVGNELDPVAGINTPLTADITYAYVPQWTLNCSLQLRADVNRVRKETYGSTVTANVQPVLGQTASTPLSELNTVTITRHGADVGQPLIYPLYWTSIAGKVVRRGTVMFPNALQMPGGMSFQIALNDGGTAGTTIPAEFSDIVGTVTVDGMVQWCSLGANPLLTAVNWTASTSVPEGQVICPTLPQFVDYQDLVAFGLSQDPPIGTDVALYQIIFNQGTYYQCSLEGTTSQGTVDSSGAFTPPTPTPSFNATPGSQTPDGDLIWTCIGPNIPNGTNFYIALSGGLTADFMPNFSTTSGATFTDNGITWLCLGVCPGYLPPPVGGTPGNITSPTFFGSTYGQTISAPYLEALPGAALIYASRVYDAEWDCIWEKALLSTLRMTATIADQRISGGTATGKIVEMEIVVDGADPKLQWGHIKIGAPVGYGGSPDAPAGYSLMPTADFAFQTPVWTPNDDGLTAPLSAGQVIVTNVTHGSAADQLGPLGTAMAYEAKLAQLVAVAAYYGQSISIDQQVAAARTPFTVDRMMKGLDVWQQLDLKPVTGSTFTEDFQIMTTPLEIDQGVNLSAASN